MKRKVLNSHTLLSLMLGFGVAMPLSAQEIVRATEADSFVSFHVAPTSLLSDDSPLLSIARQRDRISDPLVEQALDFNLSLDITPLEGLSLNAGTWRQQSQDGQAISTEGEVWQSSAGSAYPRVSPLTDLVDSNPIMGNQSRSNGFDLGASYVWDTSRFGQFTLSTKTSYVSQFENNGSLLELANSELANQDELVINPELQSSLMLTWEFGNHTASAITNYFDSFKDISELDVDELNRLVDNITTIDLQYGYSVHTGEKDRAIISFGIRNLFNEKTAQILNSTTRVLDQNGRVAYGSIKYQF